MSVVHRIPTSSCIAGRRTGAVLVGHQAIASPQRPGDVFVGHLVLHLSGVLAMPKTDIGSGGRWEGLVCRHFDAHRTSRKNVPGTDKLCPADVPGT
jgi:hypothetical protein